MSGGGHPHRSRPSARRRRHHDGSNRVSRQHGVHVPDVPLRQWPREFAQRPIRNRASRNVERDPTLGRRRLLVGKAVRPVLMLYEQFGIAAGVAHPVLGQEVRVRPLTPPGIRPSHVGGSKPLAQFPGAHGTADFVDEAPSRWRLARHQFSASFSAFPALNDTPDDGPMAMRSTMSRFFIPSTPPLRMPWRPRLATRSPPPKPVPDP